MKLASVFFTASAEYLRFYQNLKDKRVNKALNLPAYKAKINEENGKLRIFDPLRKCYVTLTPEEWVRRHVIEYLVNWGGVELQRIVTEYPVTLNGQPQRADIVVVDREGGAQMLVECKAAEVKITQEVLDQAVRYNSVVGARYLMLTNGIKIFCFEACGGGKYKKLNTIPRL